MEFFSGDRRYDEEIRKIGEKYGEQIGKWEDDLYAPNVELLSRKKLKLEMEIKEKLSRNMEKSNVISFVFNDEYEVCNELRECAMNLILCTGDYICVQNYVHPIERPYYTFCALTFVKKEHKEFFK